MRVLLALVLLGVAGAASAQSRLESETPPGSVPPAPARQAADALPGERGMMAQPAREEAVDVDQVVRAFAAAYAGEESPRMIVYFNRELTAEVQEWVATERVAIEGQSREVSGDERTDTAATVAISRQYANSDGGRVGPGERWMWEFEQAIAEMLLDARVNLIDRAVVMRRQAAAGDTVMGNSASSRTLEMQALDQYADLLVELWVVRAEDSPVGYELRAQVKDIASGRLVTTVTTWGEGMEGERPRTVLATSSGYQFIEELPTVADAAQALGVELMESLTRRWR